MASIRQTMPEGLPKDARGWREHRNRPRYQATAVVLSAIAALACLAAPLLTGQSVPSPSLLPATTGTDHGVEAPRHREEGWVNDGTEERLGRGSVHRKGDRDEDWVEDVRGPARSLQEVNGYMVGISHEGEGGTLMDGRNRCFVDKDGYHRCYPTVFFLGTSKCGTTSLARWLDNHPATHWVANPRRPHQIEQTGVKEAHVFDDPPKGNRLYEQGILHEKLVVTSPKVHADQVVIDYTPHYLAVAETPHRIADMYGGRESGLKFIVTLREPVGRSISSWEFKNEFNPKKGRQEEKRTLKKTVQDGTKRAGKLDTCIAEAKRDGLTPRERDLKRCNPRKFLETPLFVSHVGKSMYSLQLERWFNLFGRENFKVVFTDDMAVNPVGVLEDVLDFLGLDLTDEDESKGLPDLKRWKKITGMAYNKTKSKKKDELGSQVTDEIKEALHKFFEPHNRALEDLLGSPVPEAWN